MGSKGRGKSLALSDFLGDSKGRAPQREICSFYFNKGSCKFGDACRLSHSDPNAKPNERQYTAGSRDRGYDSRDRDTYQTRDSDRGDRYSRDRDVGRDRERPVYRDRAYDNQDTRGRSNDNEYRRGESNGNDRRETERREEKRVTASNPASNPAPTSFRPAWASNSASKPSTSDTNVAYKEDFPTPSRGGPTRVVDNNNNNSKVSLGRAIERGKVETVRDQFGFIRANNGQRLWFHFNDVEGGTVLRERDEVEFIVKGENKNGPSAVCVKLLGSVSILNEEEVKKAKEEKEKAEKSKGGLLPTFRPAWMSSGATPVPSPQPQSTSTISSDDDHKEEEQSSLSKKKMLDWIKTINDGDPEALLLHMTFLELALNSDEMPFTVIQPLVAVLSRREVRESDKTRKVYNAVLESKFLRNPRNLRSYILKLFNSKTPSSEEVTSLSNILGLLEEIMDRCHTYRDIPLDALASERNKAYPAHITTHIDKLTKMAADMRLQSSQSMINPNWAPEEEDFRDIPIFPTTEEILGVKSGELNPRLRANIVDGRFDNVMHYLDTHFRLLREDCLQPLREGIQAYRESLDSRDVRVYTKVKICGIMCGRNGLVYRVSFETDRPVTWAKSKRLIYGSLLCLSPDKFDTLLWATVAQRDDSLLEAKQQIDIQFPAGFEERFNPAQTYTMAESVTTYFEAYQHVLRALQQLDLDRFPFKDYLISCQSVVKPPAYIHAADKYNLSSVLDGGKTTFSVTGTWPADLETSMDPSQQTAFKQALSKEFAIIQGPPGTGKTFVGLKVMRALLDNRSLRHKGPILVVCFTNHALDQFLEGIMEFEENVVRIGSRSKSDRLRDRNIRQLTRDTLKWGQQHKIRKVLNTQLDLLQKEIDECVADLNRKEVSIEDIQDVIPKMQFDSLVEGAKPGGKMPTSLLEVIEIFRKWLGEDPRKVLGPNQNGPSGPNGPKPTPPKPAPAKKEGAAQPPVLAEGKNWADDVEDEVDDETITNIQQDRMVGDDENQYNNGLVELRGAVAALRMGAEDIPPQDVIDSLGVWDLKLPVRKQLFRYWANLALRRSEIPLSNLSASYNRYCKERNALEDALKIDVLADSAVIGMTTTGVAKFHNLVQAVQPEIIIVEEAAEVLEAHIVVALCQSTKHVILIGDHEQLRPATAVYQLSTKFHLDVSLFERMVRNNVEQVTLQRQRRMRPDISRLIAPLYPKLENHPHVMTYPDVMGVDQNVFLISHTVEEEKDYETNSKSNLHEALFIARLCEYLLLQGYKHEQITILTPYGGQVRLLTKELRKTSSTTVRITSVDNFQGEEADIILLSLVRSNPEGDIGFLKISNRVCVALSRAKIGFYIIGNASLIHKKSNLWNTVIKLLDEKKMVGDGLILRCQNHPETATKVSVEGDFKKVSDGGCHRHCNTKMNCGHVCPRLCHPYTHDKLMCNAPCLRKHSDCNHLCERRCYEDCGLCLVMVDKDLLCGHTQRAPCAESRETVKCSLPCQKRLPCRHPCTKMCGEKCTKSCMVKVEKELPCGHTVGVPCFEDWRKYKCPVACLSYLACGHKCIGTCGDCSRAKSKHLPCAEC